MASNALAARPGMADGLGEEDRLINRENMILFIGFVILAFYPAFDLLFGRTRLGALEGVLVYVVLALGLNVVVGYAGLLDLGYAAFFAIGAYTMGLLTSPASYFVRRDWVPDVFQSAGGFWLALAVSWIVSAIFGVLLGAPTLRL